MTPMAEMPRKDVPPPLELVKSRIEELLPPDARERIEAGAVVIDVRNPERFEKGHAQGAVNVSSGESAREAHAEAYAEAIRNAGGNPDDRLILVCGQGNRSARAADALRNEHGFEKAASIVGGVKLWSELGLPVDGEVVIGEEEESETQYGGEDEGDTT